MRAILLAVVLTGCNAGSKPEDCERFAKLETTCGRLDGRGSGFLKLDHEVAFAHCMGGEGYVTGDVKQKLACASKGTDCASYTRCVQADGVKYLDALKRRLAAVARTVDAAPGATARACRVPGTPQVMQPEELLGQPGAIALELDSDCSRTLQGSTAPDALVRSNVFLACDRATHVVVISPATGDAKRLRYHVVAIDTAKLLCSLETESGPLPLRGSEERYDARHFAVVELRRHLADVLRARLGIDLAP
ncbi:MAG: hypothetical protein WKG01_04320 [Kofleriaceae bacterium]